MGRHSKQIPFHICGACNSALPEDEMTESGSSPTGWVCADWYACVKRQGGKHRKPKK